MFSKKNGKPQVTRKQIQGLIDGFEKQEVEAQKALDVRGKALGDWKLAQIASQKQEALERGGVLPRAPVFYLDNTEEREHLEYTRKRALGQLSDLRRRIKLLQKALSLTPE